MGTEAWTIIIVNMTVSVLGFAALWLKLNVRMDRLESRMDRLESKMNEMMNTMNKRFAHLTACLVKSGAIGEDIIEL